MPEPLKNLYSDTFFNSLNTAMIQAYPVFDTHKFNALIFDKYWKAKELKPRMRHITESLQQFSSKSDLGTSTLKTVASQFLVTFEHMLFPNYSELYGMKHYDISRNAR